MSETKRFSGGRLPNGPYIFEVVSVSLKNPSERRPSYELLLRLWKTAPTTCRRRSTRGRGKGKLIALERNTIPTGELFYIDPDEVSSVKR